MQYLPSRKFVKTFAFFLFIGLVFLVVSEFKNPATNKEANAKNNLLVQKETGPFSKDSDEDGLYDWEELLLGTDMASADTDKNGISDGLQYKTEKLYPEVEPPPDLLEQFLNFESRVSASGSGESLNLTNSIAEEAAFRYGTSGQEGELDEKTFNQLTTALASDFSRFLPQDKYGPTNVAITKGRSTETINAYVASATLILQSEPIIYGEDPLQLINNFLQNGDPESKEKLATLGTSYVAITEGLSKLTVPETFLKTHLELLNSSNHIAQALKNMSVAEHDPVRAILGTAAYIHHSEKKRGAVTSLVSYFRVNNS